MTQRTFIRLFLAILMAWLPLQAISAPAFEDTLAQRTLPCVACHGKQGRAGPHGYYPRLAGKPVGYLYNQLLNFRDGRRHDGLMAGLVAPLTDTYLMEIAQYFSQLEVPYPPPPAATAPQQVLNRGRTLVTLGDASQKLPACTSCHGQTLTGVAPNIPGLLGLPRDYLNAQLGGWQTHQRHAMAPDCMAEIAGRMSTTDVAAVAHWLAAQPVPSNATPLSALPPAPAGAPRLRCGSALPPVTPAPQAATPPGTNTALVARGAYLARAGNCLGCHTVQGEMAYAGGRPINTPFGTVYASNLTPDKANGLGSWTSADFWEALHHGRSKDARLLNPAFPYTSFTRVTRTDSDALFAYLQTLPAAPRPNTAHALRWPFGTQAALFAWRTLYFSPGVEPNNASQSAEWNRGAYLVRGLGHCDACHTPRNALGGSNTQSELSGGAIPAQNWFAPSLWPVPGTGLAGSPAQQMAALLRSGVSPHGSVYGPMAEVVLNSTQYLTDADLTAMSVYLASLPVAQPATPSARTADAPLSAPGPGARLYEKHCASCHGEQGQGIANAYPRLVNNATVTATPPTNLLQVVLHGAYAPATAANPRPFGMPPFMLQLTDRETAALLTFIRQAWGNRAPEVNELDVNRARGQP